MMTLMFHFAFYFCTIIAYRFSILLLVIIFLFCAFFFFFRSSFFLLIKGNRERELAALLTRISVGKIEAAIFRSSVIVALFVCERDLESLCKSIKRSKLRSEAHEFAIVNFDAIPRSAFAACSFFLYPHLSPFFSPLSPFLC